jgi:hypothetical protein
LAVDFDNEVVVASVPTPAVSSEGAVPVSQEAPVSKAVERFRSCRWRKPAADGEAECCTHRDVLPLTGTRGFDPEAWCPDCEFFKLRRTPRRPH